MNIHTTINIHMFTENKINDASEKTGLSRNSIIIILLKRAMEHSRERIRLNRTVQYQERDPLKRWHKIHVGFRDDVYEFCQDMKKFYKMSVSLILSFSVKKYLNIIIEEILNNEKSIDNYPYTGYIFIQEILDDAIIWHHTWGIPRNISKLLL